GVGERAGLDDVTVVVLVAEHGHDRFERAQGVAVGELLGGQGPDRRGDGLENGGHPASFHLQGLDVAGGHGWSSRSSGAALSPPTFCSPESVGDACPPSMTLSGVTSSSVPSMYGRLRRARASARVMNGPP